MLIKGTAHLNRNLRHTVNMFGSLKDLEGKDLQVLDRNEKGDCLCIVYDGRGVAKYLVDVDGRDIHSYTSSNWFNVMEAFAKNNASRKGKSDGKPGDQPKDD